jgi:hypothetical protein
MGKILKAITPSDTEMDDSSKKEKEPKEESSALLLDKTTLFRIALWVAMQTIAYSTPIGPLKTAFTVAKFTWSSFGTIKYAFRLARAGLRVVMPKANTQKKIENVPQPTKTDYNRLQEDALPRVTRYIQDKQTTTLPEGTVSNGWTLVEESSDPISDYVSHKSAYTKERLLLLEDYVGNAHPALNEMPEKKPQLLPNPTPAPALEAAGANPPARNQSFRALSTARLDLSATFIDAF